MVEKLKYSAAHFSFYFEFYLYKKNCQPNNLEHDSRSCNLMQL